MAEPLSLSQQLTEARASTDRLFTHVNPDALYERPIPERHRMIFYLGHLEAFDWNQLKQVGMLANSPEPAFDRLFALGIDPEPGQLPSDTAADWPSLEQVRRYNREVREALDREFDHVPEDIAHMMIEHRQMHLETFAYILHNLDFKYKRGEADQSVDFPAPSPAMIPIPAGDATLGRPLGAGFGWDNEYDAFSESVPSFSVARYKVTNGEYLAFIRETNEPVPHYWFQHEGRWFYRGMFGNTPLPLHDPVYATLNQARAFAHWRGLEILTEPQYHRAAFGTPSGEEREVPWGGKNGAARGNYDFERWDPVPVNATPAGDSAFGAAQMAGNGWEWTESVFAPFPGFTPCPTYPGYSANFFDGRHFVMKGASPLTAAKLVRRSLRNWFRPDYPYVYATFRVVQN